MGWVVNATGLKYLESNHLLRLLCCHVSFKEKDPKVVALRLTTLESRMSESLCQEFIEAT